MPSSRRKPAFDGLLAAACLCCRQLRWPILSRRVAAERTAGEFARGAMADLYRRRYLLPLFAAVQNCTLDASFTPPRASLRPGAGQEVVKRPTEAVELYSLHLSAGEPHDLSPFFDFDGD
jgi:hypothetical protein